MLDEYYFYSPSANFTEILSHEKCFITSTVNNTENNVSNCKIRQSKTPIFIITYTNMQYLGIKHYIQTGG